MNQIMVAGHLGADPEVRFTSSGQKVTTIRVAAKARKGSNKSEDSTIWWKVSVWGEQFDKMMTYFKKGSAIMVTGELNKPEIFTDKEGKPQISMSITALNLQFSPFGRGGDSSHGSSSESHAPEMAYAASQESASGRAQMDTAFSDDEIPF